jgi:hypothetical protein
MSIEEVAVMAREAKDAARRLYMVNENLNKYVSTAKAAQLDLKNLKNLKRTVDIATPDLSNLKDLKRTVKQTEKIAKEGKNLWDNFLSKIKGGGNAAKAANIGSTLAALVGIGGIAAILAIKIKLDEFIQSQQEKVTDTLSKDLTKTNELAVRANLSIKEINGKIAKINAQQDKIYAEAAGAAKGTTDARQKANDALYEVRKGRDILESKIEVNRKLANDSLYETRKGRQILEDRLSGIQQKVDKFLSGVNNNFQQKVEGTIANLQQSLTKANESINLQNKTISTIQSTVKEVQNTVVSIPKSIDSKITELKDFTIKLVGNKTQPIEVKQAEIERKYGVTLNSIEGTVEGLKRTYQMSFEAKAAEWNTNISQLQKKVGEIETVTISSNFKSTTADLTKSINDLKANDNKFAEQVNNIKTDINNIKTDDSKFKSDLNNIKTDIYQTKQDINNTKLDIKKIDTQLKEQERVNQSAIPKLDFLVQTLPLLPGRAADAIRPDIPTIPEIEDAAAAGTCKTTQPGGCMNKLVNNSADNINANTDDGLKKIADAANAGANAAELALLNTINSKLGDQVSGGISGFMNRIVKNQWVDRAINLITMTAAVHNVIMLSDQAVTTFFGILDNVLAVPALIVDPNAETIDTKQAFGGVIDGFFKNIFGVTEWAEIKARWATANRIYQAAANGANEVRSIGGNIISAVEQTAQLTGKGFNAMQDEGLLSESNWDYSPEALNLKGGLFAKFGKLANGINIATEGLEAIESITSEIRSAVDSANQIKENAKEVDDGLKELIGASKAKREQEVEALPPKSYSWEDLM